jgi:hypothetical protein
MRWLLPALWLLPAVTLAAPGPKGKADGAFFPTREGDRREYEVRTGDKVEGSYADEITKVEKRDGALHVSVTRTYPESGSAVSVIAVSADGLFRVAANGQAVDPPTTLLKLPARVGTKWDYEGGATYTVIKVDEEVEVPAGKFKAVRVELADPGAAARTTLWFSPAVGVIKITSGTDRVQVLKAFTPGK